jgi:glycine C-acetyltransferase
VAASLKALELLQGGAGLRSQLHDNTQLFRSSMTELGFDVLPGDHPIVPVMYGDAALAARTADAMLERGIYVIAFSYPVVPKGQARIRTQMSAAHSRSDIERAIAAFTDVRTAVPAP